MALAEAISPRILILLLYLQNSLAQQCLNNGFSNSPVLPQQNYQKSSCVLNQIAQNGLNFNSPQQVNYQQQSNIQQAPFEQQTRNQPQLNSQQGNSQQSVNSMSNSQPLQQPNHDLAANIFSGLYNIKQSIQNQRGTRNVVKGNPSQQNYELLPPSQNQPNPTLTASGAMSKPQNSQPAISNSFSENSQVPSGFTFKFVPANNVVVQPNQQMFALPVTSQPITSSVPSQQATAMQSPIMMIPGTQTQAVQNQPIVLTFQSPEVQNQPMLPTQTSYGQPIKYTVQTQPSSAPYQKQQILEAPSQKQITNNPSLDKQSLMSYVMSQMQNPQGSGNMLASILPAMLNTKSEKPSSMKSLLPLIINILNDKKSCCGCPHCGCNNSNNDQPRPEPIINTGYSNHVNYSQQKPVEASAKITENIDKSIESISDEVKQEKPKDVDATNNSTETSEENETETNDSEEEYDEE